MVLMTMLKPIRTHFKLILARVNFLFMLVFAVVAYAQVVDPTSMDPNALIQLVIACVKAGDWKAVVALAVVGFVWLVRKYGSLKFPALKSDRWSAVLTLISGIVGGAAYVFINGGTVDARAVFDGVTVGATAAGGYVLVKKIIWPDTAKLAADVVGTATAADPSAIERKLNE